MRIYLKLSKNLEPVPFSYQQNLVGAFHKWVGINNIHDGLSLYSMSWLSQGRSEKGKSLNFDNGAVWFISSPDVSLIKQIIKGIQQSPEVAFGMYINEVVIKQTPKFPNSTRFNVATPVLVRNKEENGVKHYGFDEEKANELLTNTLAKKLSKAGIKDDTISVVFDKNYWKAKRKLITYKGVGNKANLCPVIITGSPEAVAFAWDVGVGHSTGIGFGALI